MNETYEIKITGNGTREEIISDLKNIIEGIEAANARAVELGT